jgi:transposase-like protein
VNHVVEEKQNFLGKKFVKTVRNQERKKLVVINPNPKLLEVA